jgi:hypothetical protein
MHARVRNHHVAGLGSIATSTATKLCNRLGPKVGKIIGMAHERAPIAMNDEREATATDIKKLVEAAELHIADIQAAAAGNPEKA